jgi:AcrR family transcriptional regulator
MATAAGKRIERPSTRLDPDGSEDAAGTRPRGRAPRLTALQRRDDIVTQAVQFFAETGFGGTTRALADRLGVRQALIYRYFPSKDALVDAVFRRVTEGRWTQDLSVLLADRTKPLEERLAQVYSVYGEQDEGVGIRLLMRAALDGLPVPARRGATLTTQILEPLIVELRHEARLPSLERTPLLPAERELALMLHSAMLQLGVREHIFRSPPLLPRAPLTELYVATFLVGARETIRGLHKRPAPGTPGRTALERLRAKG